MSTQATNLSPLLFRVLSEGIQTGVLVVDRDLSIIYWNRWFSHYVGLDLAEYEGRILTDVFPLVVKDGADQIYSEVLTTGQTRFLAPRFHPPVFVSSDRERSKSHYLRLLPIQHEERGEVQGVLTVIEDFTQVVEHERALRETQLFLEKTFVSLNDAIFVIDSGTRKIISCNPAVEEIFGYTKEQVIGRNTEFLHVDKEMYAQFGEELFPALSERGFFSTEFKMRAKDGRVFDSEHVVTELRDEAGQRVGVVSMVRDISERLEHELEREALLRDLEAKNRELETFVYTISHDLKSPLVSLSGFAKNLQRRYADQLDHRGTHYIQRIHANVIRMELLVTNLMELSRIGKVVGELLPVPMENLIAEVLDSIAVQIDEFRVQVIVEKPLPVVNVDRTRIMQVIANLVENAIKFRDPARQLRIEIGHQEKDGKHRFHVRDNGLGINPQFAERIFLPFQKLNNDIEGMGIGLALVKRTIEYHNGQVWVESSPGDGATFYFTLPK